MCAFAGGACATALGGAGAQTAQGDTPYAAVEQLGRVLVDVENEYVDPVDRAKLVDGAIKGMVAELDPHSSYMPPEEFQAFESDTEGEFGGIGIEVESRNDQLIVLVAHRGVAGGAGRDQERRPHRQRRRQGPVGASRSTSS